jgi:tetrahydromethanopterin S-methyltransferase subunit G
VVSNLITAQVVRYVTDKVMENIARQAGRALPNGEAMSPDVTTMAVAARFNQKFERIDGRLDDVEARLEEFRARLVAAEKRAGWRHTLRLTFGILAGIAVGVGATLGARLVGWIG